MKSHTRSYSGTESRTAYYANRLAEYSSVQEPERLQRDDIGIAVFDVVLYYENIVYSADLMLFPVTASGRAQHG